VSPLAHIVEAIEHVRGAIAAEKDLGRRVALQDALDSLDHAMHALRWHRELESDSAASAFRSASSLMRAVRID